MNTGKTLFAQIMDLLPADQTSALDGSRASCRELLFWDLQSSAGVLADRYGRVRILQVCEAEPIRPDAGDRTTKGCLG